MANAEKVCQSDYGKSRARMRKCATSLEIMRKYLKS